MFGFGIHSVFMPDRLVVTSPFNVLFLLGASLITVWPLWVLLSMRPLPRGKITFCLVLTILVYGFLLSGSKLTLDRLSNTATLTEYFFFHWTTEKLPLSSIEGASLRTGSTSSQIQLQLAGGGYRLLSELNQSGGKEKAIYDINQFLHAETR